MATITAPLTVEQFLKLPEEQTLRCELVEGEIVPMGNAGRQHEWVKANINRQLVQLARALTGDPDKLFEGAPDLAIEVVSSETAEFLERKIALYLETGSQAVWVAYPKHRTLWTHHADGIARVLKEDQYLEEPGLLPGFRVLVSNFFEGL